MHIYHVYMLPLIILIDAKYCKFIKWRLQVTEFIKLINSIAISMNFKYTQMAAGEEEGSEFRGLISQQEKFSMVKIESYGGLLK